MTTSANNVKMEADYTSHEIITAVTGANNAGNNFSISDETSHDKEKLIYSFWQTLIDPNKLFPEFDPLIATIVYIGIILLIALLLLLLVWVTAVWCHESKLKKKQRRFQSSLLHRDLFPHTLSSFGSNGCLSTATTSSYGSLSSLVRMQNHGHYGSGSLQRYCPHGSHFHAHPAVGCNCNFYATTDFSKKNTKKQLKKVKSMNEKSMLLRGSSIHHHSHDSFLDKPSSRESISSYSIGNDICRDCLKESCHGRFCQLPRAKWDGETMLTFIREQSLKQKQKSNNYGTMKDGLTSPTPPSSDKTNSKVGDDGFPPPPMFTL